MKSKYLLRYKICMALGVLVVFFGVSNQNAFAQRSNIQIGEIVISEFRQTGPAGTRDEYIELFNTTSEDLSIERLVIGYSRSFAENSFSTFALNTASNKIIKARSYYLIANNPADGSSNRYSLSAQAASDFGIESKLENFDTFEENLGLTLVQSGTPSRTIDSVGFAGQNQNPAEGIFVGEGTLLPTTAFPSTRPQYAYVRKLSSGAPQDTDNNANDFQLVSNSQTVGQNSTPTGIVGVLGAPDPQNTNSARTRGLINGFRIDPFDSTAGVTQPPNTVVSYNETPPLAGSAATINFRRRFTNVTTFPVTKLRVHVVRLSTFNGGSSTDPDARLVDSPGVTLTRNGQAVAVTGVKLDVPPSSTAQGGGINSTGSIMTITMANPLPPTAPNNTIDVEIKFSVQTRGTVNYAYFVEGATNEAATNLESSNIKNALVNAPLAYKARSAKKR